MIRRAALVAFAALAVACARPPSEAPPPPFVAPAGTRGPSFDVYAFDVGTGLSMLVRGRDFAMLYDGGSNDDRATGERDRLLAYLARVLGPSGGAGCHPGGAAFPARRIDHVVLSHPHRDHVQFLADVVRCFDVANAWDSGADSDARAYRGFLDALAASPRAVYHAARAPSDAEREQRRVPLDRWRSFGAGTKIPLGEGALATVLHVESRARDLNDASIVLRVDLGRASLLLTGDVTAGKRADPSEPPAPGSGEDELLRTYPRELDVDILQVAHHGSRTSSRARFLDAVTPAWAIVSSGPMRYGPVTLPDAEVVRELLRRGTRVLRTDDDDAGCATRADKVGPTADGAPGGCSTYRLHVDPSGRVALAPWDAP